MAAFTNYAENKIADALFRAQSLGAPATWHVGLFTATPSDTGGGTEVSGGSYARVSVTAGLTAFNGTHGTTTGASSGTGGTVTNAASWTFPSPTANWGSITHWGLFDAPSSGNLWVYGALTTGKTVNNGDAAPVFSAGSASVQIDN